MISVLHQLKTKPHYKMKKQQLKQSPSPASLQGTIQGQKEQLEQNLNQIHILKTTNQELRDKLSEAQLVLDRKERMFKQELQRSRNLDEALSGLRIELAALKDRWYVRWFS